MYDLVVSGAGPIGSFLAWKFSERGYRVLVLEEHKEIGKPLACSGLISKKIWDFVPYNKKIIEHKINGARIHVGEKVHVFNSDQAQVINRPALDKHIFNLAKKSGVKYLLDSRLINFFEGETVSIYVKRNEKIKNMKTKVLAGCDGPLSTVRRNLGLRDPKYLHGIFTYVAGNQDSFVDLYFKEFPGFFAWRIPRGAYTEYGLASSTKAKFHFTNFLRKHGIKPAKIFSGLIPYGLLPKISSKRVFLCGDAAAQVKPYSGGGVVYGLTAAEIASQTIDLSNPDMRLYEKEWRKKIGREIKTGLWIKRFYSLPKPFLNIALNKISKRKNLNMDKPSSIF